MGRNNLKVYKLDFYPLTTIFIYISIGVLLSFFGPIEYLEYDKLSVFFYIVSFLILFSVGYVLGVIDTHPSSRCLNVDMERYKLQRVLFWVKVNVAIIATVQLIILLVSIADGSLNLSVSKMGEAYVNLYKDYERGTGQVSAIFFVQTITYIPYIVTLILGSYYFKSLPKTYKLLVVFTFISVVLLETIGHGKQKQFGDIFIILVISLLLKSNLQYKSVRKIIFRKMFVLGFIGVSILVTVLYFRYAALNIDVANINSKSHPLMQYDTENLVFDVFGDNVGFPVAAFTGYLSQGYYGLSLSMQQPFEWTYFVGNSYSLSVFLHRYIDIPVDYHDTYPYRAALDTGWGDSKWSTVFAWYAGDLTFIGTLFMFFVVAFFYAKVWREAYIYRNPISIVLFTILTIGLVYVPANNQLLHTPGSFIATFYFVILWGMKHRKFNFNALDSNGRNRNSG